jgi:hypothetical protein
LLDGVLAAGLVTAAPAAAAADSHLALDGRRDSLVCGAGTDSREADPVDLIDPSCE